MFLLFFVSLFKGDKLTKQLSQKTSGFGLIELLISISIIVLVTSVILVRQSSFNGAVLLRGQAYEVALQIRGVQQSAVSSVGDGGNFRSVIGVHFDINNNQRYAIFRDANDNNYFDGNEMFGLQGFIDQRFEIRELREADGSDVDEVSIVFQRPNFDARFFESGGELVTSSIQIDVARAGTTGSGPDELRTIEVSSTGQIAVLRP